MHHIIIGTAGHVDHGKTLLVKALTGMDTDQLPQEKEQGITIQLGFAWLALPDGNRAGIIDVPGHERFVKNMLAGAGGIDLALLVVAADDGVMPQTREHLGILQLLGIRQGIIVLTKTDLVDQPWREAVTEEIQREVADSFLAGAPLVAVSARTGEGIEALRQEIFRLAEATVQRSGAGPFRLPVDRVFSVDGFGTVVTGTLIEGRISVGDQVTVYPAGRAARVRSLQVHGHDAPAAYGGQRVAVNLAGIQRAELQRGDTIAAQGSMTTSLLLDVKLQLLKDSRHPVATGSRLHFYHGAGDVLCKVVLLDRDELAPGEACYAQLHFAQPVAAGQGDRFVVRFYSPVDTVGGGVILDASPVRHRRNKPPVLAALRIRELGSPADHLWQAIADASHSFPSLAHLQQQLGLEGEIFQQALTQLVENRRIVLLSKKTAVSAGFVASLGETAEQILGDYHRQHPLQPGMRRDELRSRLLPGQERMAANTLLEHIAEQGRITLDSQIAALADFSIQYSPRDREIAEGVEHLYQEAGYAPPGLEEVCGRYPKEKLAVEQVLDALLAGGVLTAVAPGLHFHSTVVADAQRRIAEFILTNGGITLAQFRDLSGTSRKFALALLEYFDRHGITKKVGDSRILAGKSG